PPRRRLRRAPGRPALLEAGARGLARGFQLGLAGPAHVRALGRDARRHVVLASGGLPAVGARDHAATLPEVVDLEGPGRATALWHHGDRQLLDAGGQLARAPQADLAVARPQLRVADQLRPDRR